MKKLHLLVILAIMLAIGTATQAQAVEQNMITVFVDGLPVNMDTTPVMQNGRTMVPFRALAEALGVNVTWDSTSQTVHATDGNISVRLQPGNSTAYKNNSAIALDAPPLVVDGRTLIPLRFFSEAFNCKVTWDGSVKITSPPRKMFVTGFYALGDAGTSSWTNLFGTPYPNTTR